MGALEEQADPAAHVGNSSYLNKISIACPLSKNKFDPICHLKCYLTIEMCAILTSDRDIHCIDIAQINFLSRFNRIIPRTCQLRYIHGSIVFGSKYVYESFVLKGVYLISEGRLRRFKLHSKETSTSDLQRSNEYNI